MRNFRWHFFFCLLASREKTSFSLLQIVVSFFRLFFSLWIIRENESVLSLTILDSFLFAKLRFLGHIFPFFLLVCVRARSQLFINVCALKIAYCRLLWEREKKTTKKVCTENAVVQWNAMQCNDALKVVFFELTQTASRERRKKIERGREKVLHWRKLR